MNYSCKYPVKRVSVIMSILVLVSVLCSGCAVSTALGSDPPDTECPCFTVEDLDSLYNQLIASQGVTDPYCMEQDYSSSEGYPPYTYYYVTVCNNSSSCDVPLDIEAGVYSGHPRIGDPGGNIEFEAWNAVCYVVEGLEGDGRNFHLYDANLTRGEVKACSSLFKSSQWGQRCN